VSRRGLLWTALRAAVALAAITWLVLAVDWHDRVVVPAGYPLSDAPSPGASTIGASTTGARSLAVVGEANGVLRLALAGGVAEVPRSSLGSGPGQPRLAPGILSVIATLSAWQLALLVLLVASVMPVQALRWWLLLRARGIAPSAGATLRLHLIGCFWNLLFPGLTGGDAVKAWQVAQGSGRTADAILSVLVDRMLGILALFLLAAGAGLMLSDSAAHHSLALRVWLALAVLAAGLALWLSPALGRLTGIDRLLAWALEKPRLAQPVAALVAYRGHHATLLAGIACSFVGHILLVGSCIFAARAVGIATSWQELFVLLSLIFVIGAVPISLFGLGVMEVAAVALLADSAGATQVISMLVLYRCAAIAAALPGGLLLIGNLHRWGGPGSVAPAAGTR
jgi:uncharacterized membrane protein YbhN (UPF0104 family)